MGNIFNLQKMKVHRDLTAAIQYLKRAAGKLDRDFLQKACTDWTRRNVFKLEEDAFRSGIRRKFFTVRIARHRKRLPR